MNNYWLDDYKMKSNHYGICNHDIKLKVYTDNSYIQVHVFELNTYRYIDVHVIFTPFKGYIVIQNTISDYLLYKFR